MEKRGCHVIVAVLFDLEGTLVGSIENDKQSIVEFRVKTRKKLLELGIPAWALLGVYTSTLMRNKAFEYVEKQFNDEEVTDFYVAIDKFLKRFELSWAGRARIFEDTIPTLSKLQALKLKLGVVTNTSKEAAEKIFESNGLEPFFDVTITREDIKRLKPDPEGIILALERLDTKDFFFVGDLVHDSQAAKRAEGISITVNRPPLKTVDFHSDYIVSSLFEIPSIVAGKL